MNIKDLYEKIGGKYNDVLGRLSKDAFVEKFALMYLNDNSYDILMSAIEAGDIVAAFRGAHSLKGVAANLGFEELRKAATELTEQLRPQDTPANADLVDCVKKAQQKIIAGLQEYQSSK